MSDPAAIPPLTIALGGVDLSVQFLTGETETVKVRLLTISEYPRFYELLDNEARLAEFFCRKETGWADGLHPNSVMDLVEKGMELNFTPARRWAERRGEITEANRPLAERMATLMKSISASSALTAVLPSAVAPPPK
jgi:hypothetical protein